MKYIDEFRDQKAARALSRELHRITTRPWNIMEVCGGQTHAILRFGIDRLLPPGVELLHGPGCPVCVTPVEKIDKAVAIARCPNVTLCSFGDMLRVPGSRSSLARAKAEGADVRVVYSPLDALKLATRLRPREVVFFAVGFETTAPAHALAVYRAKEEGVTNFSLLVSHVLVPPAMTALLSDPERRVQAFLAAGHVCTVMGTDEYIPMAARFGVPIVVTGFEPVDILQGVHMAVAQLEAGRAEVEIQYSRSVHKDGNVPARRLIRAVFEVVPRHWRGMGEIPESGLALRPEYADYDAERKFDVVGVSAPEDPECKAGLVLAGRLKPPQCPEFGVRCTPEHPLGAPMVSSEGACAAYYRYRAFEEPAESEEFA